MGRPKAENLQSFMLGFTAVAPPWNPRSCEDRKGNTLERNVETQSDRNPYDDDTATRP